jgi:hypothetical protein
MLVWVSLFFQTHIALGLRRSPELFVHFYSATHCPLHFAIPPLSLSLCCHGLYLCLLSLNSSANHFSLQFTFQERGRPFLGVQAVAKTKSVCCPFLTVSSCAENRLIFISPCSVRRRDGSRQPNTHHTPGGDIFSTQCCQWKQQQEAIANFRHPR